MGSKKEPPLVAAKILRNWLGILILAATALVLFWLAFAFTLSNERSPDVVLDNQALSWLALKWDVAPPLDETFENEGKHYYYYGPFPSVLRVPLLVIPQLKRMDHGFLLFFASLLNLCAAILVFRSLGHLLHREVFPETLAMLSLAAGLGSSLVIIASRPSVYHETIAWGSGMILMAVWSYLEYLKQLSSKWIFATAAFCLLSSLSRGTWLISSVILLASMAPIAFGKERSFRMAAVPLAAGLAVWSCVLLVGHAKFGGLTLSPPLNKHIAFQDPSKLQKAGGAMFHLTNLRTGVVNYFALDNLSLRREFPYVFGPAALHMFPESKYDGSEEFVSLPWVMGSALILGAFGIWSVLRSDRILLLPLTALTLGSCPLFLFVGLCGRYLHDFYPPLVFGAALGLLLLGRGMSGSFLKKTLPILLSVNVIVSLAMAANYQIELGPSQRKVAFYALRGFPTYPSASQQWSLTHSLSLKYRIGELNPGLGYPLLTTGRPGSGSFTWLRVDPSGRSAYCFNSWGHSDVPCSDPLDIHTRRDYVVRFAIDGRHLTVAHNGALVLETDAAFNGTDQPVWVGVNPIGGGLTVERFPGEFAVERSNVNVRLDRIDAWKP